MENCKISGNFEVDDKWQLCLNISVKFDHCQTVIWIGYNSELQIEGGIDDNAKIIFRNFQQKHMLWPLIRTVSGRQF